MSKNSLSQQAQLKPGRADTRGASLNFFEKNGDCRDYQAMIDAWRIRNGLEPMYFKETANV